MPQVRQFAWIAILCPAILAMGCGSNNEGKIVGKWKVVGGKEIDKQKAQMDQMKAYLYMEFKADNAFVMGLGFTDPNMQKMMGPAMEKAAGFTAKYKLMSGDKVEVYDVPKEKGVFGNKDRAQTNISINGNKMTMTDPDGSSYTLEKI